MLILMYYLIHSSSEGNTRCLHIGSSKRIVNALVLCSIGSGLRVFVVLLLILGFGYVQLLGVVSLSLSGFFRVAAK
jgi:hypothetical protein